MKEAFPLKTVSIVLMIVSGLGVVARGGSTPLTTTRVASGLTLPLYVTAPPGDFARAFIVEQRSGTTGRIRILQLPSNTLLATPYLSISPVSTGNEEGLLGLAFHPDFLNNGFFWVYYTTGGNNTVVRYQANAPFATSTTANPASATPVLTLTHPNFSNHNGGCMAFGPDGYLYINTGDGGSANDPPGNAQNINSFLGKMLRLDVDGSDNLPGNDDDDGVIGMTLPPYTSPPTNPFVGVAGLDEIWSIGLRNPWRSSFDRATGDIYIGDVGQNATEEIDFEPAGSPSTPVRNYGWRCMEGNSCTGLTGCTCEIGCAGGPLTCPIHTYSHAGGNCSVTGGYVYRGCAMPAMHGIYFFADYCTAQIWSFQYPSVAITNRTAELAPGGGLAINTITSFGEDAFGEVYICDQGGEVFKIIPAAATAALGACCMTSPEECVQATQSDCESRGGEYLGDCESCAGIICEPGVPQATALSALSRKANPNPSTGGFCNTPTHPSLGTEAHAGGVTELLITFDVAPGTPSASDILSNLEQSTCAVPAFAPYSGPAGVTPSVAGNTLELDFAPGLETAKRYRLTLAASVTGIAGQSVQVRSLTSDVNGDGLVDSTDRSVVVGAWTGSGFTCATDVNSDGVTDSTDRSIVVGAWTGAQNCAP